MKADEKMPQKYPETDANWKVLQGSDVDPAFLPTVIAKIALTAKQTD
ncbi:MAG TPA: hypothetical protein PLY09_10340 [Methanothrix sp.]|nr:hypothetical protein [Methanothrix sp.]